MVEIGKYFTAHIAHGENYKSKVDNIKLMIEKYQIEKGIYVGDTDSDGKSAVKAGIPFIFMDYGFGYTTEYSLKFDHFTEFVNYAVKD